VFSDLEIYIWMNFSSSLWTLRDTILLSLFSPGKDASGEMMYDPWRFSGVEVEAEKDGDYKFNAEGKLPPKKRERKVR